MTMKDEAKPEIKELELASFDESGITGFMANKLIGTWYVTICQCGRILGGSGHSLMDAIKEALRGETVH